MSSNLTMHLPTLSYCAVQDPYHEHDRRVDVQLCVETRRSATQSPNTVLWAISWSVGTRFGVRILRREPRSILHKLGMSSQKRAVTSTLDVDQPLSGRTISIADMECYTLGALTPAQRMELLRIAASNGVAPGKTDREWVQDILKEAMARGLFESDQVGRCVAEALL